MSHMFPMVTTAIATTIITNATDTTEHDYNNDKHTRKMLYHLLK